MAAHATIHMFVNKGFNKVLAVFNSIFDSDIGKIIKTQVKVRNYTLFSFPILEAVSDWLGPRT